MDNSELEEKVIIMEELIQGFIKRIDSVETETQAYFKSALVHYKQTLDEIAERLKKASQPQEDNNFIRQIEELKSLIATMPKVFTVKNSYHFGAWSKSFIIGVFLAFLITSGSFGTALYLKNQNAKLKEEAFNFWLVKTLYPEVWLMVQEGLKANRDSITGLAEKTMYQHQSIQALKAKINKTKRLPIKTSKKLKAD